MGLKNDRTDNEFNLSKKRKIFNPKEDGFLLIEETCLLEKDVKEFIRLSELENKDLMSDVLDLLHIHKVIEGTLRAKLILLFAAHHGERDKLAGEVLIKTL